MFDTAHDPAQLTDPLFARAPGIRVPGTWSGWELAVRAVLGQQVSVAGARRTAHKLIELHGDGFPPPEALVDGALPGMPASRARALRALAEAVAGGLVLDPPLDRAPHPRAAARAARLRPLDGRVHRDARAARPGRLAGDATSTCAASPPRPTPERWRPWRAYAAMVLWQT